jgi:hypothetical protein
MQVLFFVLSSVIFLHLRLCHYYTLCRRHEVIGWAILFREHSIGRSCIISRPYPLYSAFFFRHSAVSDILCLCRYFHSNLSCKISLGSHYRYLYSNLVKRLFLRPVHRLSLVLHDRNPSIDCLTLIFTGCYQSDTKPLYPLFFFIIPSYIPGQFRLKSNGSPLVKYWAQSIVYIPCKMLSPFLIECWSQSFESL